MATLTKVFSDIDLTFTKKPVTGDIALSYDNQAVIRSVRNLILTQHYERPFNPELGSAVNALLFEPCTSLSARNIEKEIQNVLANYEPRVDNVTVRATPSPDQNSYAITITFFIQNLTVPTTITMILERNR